MDSPGALIAWIARDVLAIPACLVALLTLGGLAASGRTRAGIGGATLKAVLGFVILAIGSGAVVEALTPLGNLVVAALGVGGIVPADDAITGLLDNAKSLAQNIGIAMILGLILSLVLARLTPLHYVFLTGPHIVAMTSLLSVVLAAAGATDSVQIGVAAFGLATLMVAMPAFSMPWLKKVTGGEAVAMGHFGSLGFVVAGLVGQVVGRGSRSTEAIRVPQALRFLRDPLLGTAVALVIVYLVLAAGLGAGLGLDRAVKETTSAAASGSAPGGASGGALGGWPGWFARILNDALVFGGGMAVILLGVRTILGEIAAAFAGLAERVVPDAVPALDCPVVFAYAPNAVVVGFLASLIGGLLGLGVLSAANRLSAALAVALVLPALVGHFFSGGTAGVFGNATGGRRGAVGGGLANGFLTTILAALLVPRMGQLGAPGTAFAEADLQLLGLTLGSLAGFGSLAAAAGIVVACVGLLGVATWWQRRFVDSGWLPGGSENAAEPARAAPAEAQETADRTS